MAAHDYLGRHYRCSSSAKSHFKPTSSVATTSDVRPHPGQPSDVAAGIMKDRIHHHNPLACRVQKRSYSSCSFVTSAIQSEGFCLLEMADTLG